MKQAGSKNIDPVKNSGRKTLSVDHHLPIPFPWDEPPITIQFEKPKKSSFNSVQQKKRRMGKKNAK